MLGLVFPAPPKASWLLLLSFGAWPIPLAYSIASCTRAASEAGARGGKGAGRGGTGEEEYGRGKKAERPAGQGMTSLPADSEGAGPGFLGPSPRASGGGVTGQGRNQFKLMAVLLTSWFHNLGTQSDHPGPGRSGPSFMSPRGGICRKRRKGSLQILNKYVLKGSAAEGSWWFGLYAPRDSRRARPFLTAPALSGTGLRTATWLFQNCCAWEV